MDINIKATKTTLSPSVREFIEEKFKTLARLIKPEDKIRVELEVDKKHHSGLVFRCEVDIQPHGHYADARGNDLYEAMDLLIPKIKQQLTREKDKKVSLRRRRAKIH